MIAYTDIYEAVRKERYSNDLQPISKNFIFEIAQYFKEKKQIINEKGKEGVLDIKVKKQIENATTFFKELLVRRRKKILDLVLIAVEAGTSKQDFENMMNFEKELFVKLMECMKISDSKLNQMLDNPILKKKEPEDKIIFKEKVEGFVGLNAEKMGPFNKGEVVSLPKKITKILIDGKKAEKVKN